MSHFHEQGCFVGVKLQHQRIAILASAAADATEASGVTKNNFGPLLLQC